MKACWDFWAINGRNYYNGREHARRGWSDVCNEPQAAMLGNVRGGMLRSLGNYDIRAELAAVSAPALIVQGERDPIPIAAGQAWAAALPASQLLLIPGSGHLPHVDRPDVFFPAAEAFLREGRRDGARAPTAYEALFDELAEVSRRVAAAVSAQEWERAATGYTADALLLTPGAPPVEGHSAIAAFWRAAYGRGLRTVELQTMQVERSGDVAIELGKYLIRGENATILDVGKFMAVMRREANGWRLYRDMYNSSLETRSPLEIPDYLPPPVGTWRTPTPR